MQNRQVGFLSQSYPCLQLPNLMYEVALVDAFVGERARGNPAGVCLVPAWPDEAILQAIATRVNLSETAFLKPTSAPDTYALRWFTPACEVDLCGHATLAAAHWLRTQHHAPADKSFVFETQSGHLTAHPEGDGFRLDFPAEIARAGVSPPNLQAALGALPVGVARNRMDLLVEVADAATVAQLRPDLQALAQWEVRGVLVTARADEPGTDFVSRCFFPAYGVDEDPVTGSAHCALGPYWADRLGRARLRARQLSARGGELVVTVVGDRVLLAGKARSAGRMSVALA